VVAAVDYRHGGVAPFPAQLDDVKAALRWIREHPDRCHADVDRLGVWGASAGGTLDCLLGLAAGEQSQPGSGVITRANLGVKCVVAFFPTTDLERLFTDEFPVGWGMRYAVRHLLGDVETKDKPELARQASPSHWVRPGVAAGSTCRPPAFGRRLKSGVLPRGTGSRLPNRASGDMVAHVHHVESNA